jgi:hypothetical protein
MGVKQGTTLAIQPHLSLIVPLPLTHDTLLALQETMRHAVEHFAAHYVDAHSGEALDSAATYEIVLLQTSDVESNPPSSPSPSPSGEEENSTVPQLVYRVAATGAPSVREALLATMQQASGRFIAVLDGRCPGAPLLPSAETFASMLYAAEGSDVVIASRFLPGACCSRVTNSQGLRDDFNSWRIRSLEKLAAVACSRRLASCSDLGSNLYLVERSVVKDLQIPAAESCDGRQREAASVLLEILVRSAWTRLVETPYRGADEPSEEITNAQPAVSLATLRSLRRGPRAGGPVRYRYQHLPPGPDDPEPLDDELPDESLELAGKRRRRLLWTIGLLALALRIILLPIGHWWDLTVDYNTFIDLAHNVSPYTTMQYLSHIAWASGWDYNYEYYAYPPVPLYIYYPLAHLYLLIHPQATYYIPVSGTYALPNLSLDFFLLLKFPIWIADFGIAALLARMSGTTRGFRDYLLNPYVLLVSGAWTFDAVMVLGLVLAIYYLQKGKLASSGVALAFGTMVKFIPAIAAPTIVLYLIKKKRPVYEIVLFVAAYGIACLVLLGPFLNGLLYVVNFHSNRVPGGMDWQMLFRLSTFFPAGVDLDPLSLALGAFGTPTLVILLLLGYWYCFTARRMTLNRMILVSLLAFLLGSKLVNEQYALVVFPFAFLEARRVGGAWRWLARLLWMVPLAFAIFRVQIDRFFWLLYRNVWGPAAKAIADTARTGFSGQFVPWSNLAEQHSIVLILAVGFNVLCLVAFFWPIRPSVRPCHHLEAVEALSQIPGGRSGTLEQRADEGASAPAPAIALQ